VTDRPHVRLYRLWEGPEAPGTSGARRPGGGRHPGRLCALAGAQGPPADPYRWQRSLEVLNADGIPVSEYLQNAARMGPATARAYALSVDGTLSHDGDPALTRHVANAIPRPARGVPGWPGSTRTAPAGSTPACRWSWPCIRPPSLPTQPQPSTPSSGRGSFRLPNPGRPIRSTLGAKQIALGATVDGLIPRRLGRISAAAPGAVLLTLR
jgi:hypothetical protein